MHSILQFCHKSPENLALIRGNAKWLGLPELTLTSECPTRWNSSFLCAQRMVKIEDPLNVTLTQVDRKDLVLGKLEILLLKDLISELKQFYTITNMVCTNTQYSFNNYTPMMEIIKTMLSNEHVDAEITYTETITDFRNIMLKQFSSYK